MRQSLPPSVRREDREGACVLTIDRPQARNALSRQAGRELIDHVVAASAEESVRAIIITGGGSEVFVAGGDLKDYDKLPAERTGAEQVTGMREMLDVIEGCSVPVIAAVQGNAYGGGCELLTACDVVVLEQQVHLHFKQAAMGLATGWGGGSRLIERVGSMMAARLLFTGEILDAEAAVRIGMATDIAPAGRSLEYALRLVDQMAKLPRPSLAAIKQVLLTARQSGRTVVLERERQVFAELWGRPEHKAAMDAFFKRTAPVNTSQ